MQFQGVYTAILTPFQTDGTVDYTTYENLVERQITAKVTGIVVCGTTGESPTLSWPEQQELVRRTVERAKGRVQVLAGTGGNNTASSITKTQAIAELGVDAVMLVNPYYNKPTQEGLYQHFKTIAGATALPVLLYNIKGRTSVNLEVDTLLRLLEIENIKGIKEASGDPAQMARIQQACGSRLTMLSGDDILTPAVMALGGLGVVSVISNLYPRRMVQMLAAYLQHDYPGGNRIFYDLFELLEALFLESNPIPLKAAAQLLGLCQNTLRLPLTTLQPAYSQKLQTILERLGADE